MSSLLTSTQSLSISCSDNPQRKERTSCSLPSSRHSWCQPCKMLSPVLEKLTSDASTKSGSGHPLYLVTVNTDEEVSLAGMYQVRRFVHVLNARLLRILIDVFTSYLCFQSAITNTFTIHLLPLFVCLRPMHSLRVWHHRHLSSPIHP